MPRHSAEGNLGYPRLVLTFGTDLSEIASIASLNDSLGVIPGCLTLEATVIYCSPSVRWVRELRSSGSTDQSREVNLPLFSITLADRTGCMFLELWRDAALRVYDQAQVWHEDEEIVMIRVSFFTVLDGKIKTLPRSCRIYGTDNAVVERITSTSSPYLVDPRVNLDSTLFIRTFSTLTTTPPFETHITGIVSAIGDIKLTLRRDELRNFRLHDTEGSYVECKALGRHAMNPYLQVQNELVIFGAVAHSGLRGSEDCMWIFDNSHIIRINSGRTVPIASNRIVFHEAEDEDG